MNVLSQLGKGAHAAIIRIRSLGDCVLTTPAIHLLKSHRPDLRIGIVVEPRFAAIFENNRDIDDVLPPTLPALRRFAPRLCVNLHGGTRSAFLTLASGAKFRAGFHHYRFPQAYNIGIPRAQQILRVERAVHTAEHVASAMFHLGVPHSEIPRARLFAKPLPAAQPYAILHPFASTAEKTWPAERFLELAHHLQSRCGLAPIFIGAPTDDLEPFQSYRTLTPPLDQSKSLLAGAALFIGNDSGPAHIAAAFGVPLVVLFAASDPIVWAPWKTQAETIVAKDGIRTIPASRVIHALETLRGLALERLRAQA